MLTVVRELLGGGHCDFRFCGLDIFLIGFSVFVSKDVGFSGLVFNAVCGFSVLRVKRHKINTSMRGALGFSVLRFCLFFGSVFRFLCQKTLVFRF